VRPDPLGKLRSGTARIQLDLVPVGILQEFGVGEPKLLRTRVADKPDLNERAIMYAWRTDLPEADMCSYRLRNVFLATNLQTRGYGNGIFNCLCSTVSGCWKVGVCSVADLNNPCARRCPGRLRVAPKKLEVDNGVWWSDFDEFSEDGRPLVYLHTWHLIHTLQDFFFVDGVTPALLLRTRYLDMSVKV
jgi:hypothetical protein